jgi:DNA-binding NtrC family response regulator
MTPSPAGQPAPAPASSAPIGLAAIVPLDQMEKQAILQAVDACGGNRTQAARLLGISVRTMRNKLREYGVAPGGSDGGADDSDAASDEATPA